MTSTSDWMYLCHDTFKVTASPRYLKHKGKPVVSVWGFGFPDRSITGDVAAKIINWFKTDAPAKYQATIMGGVNDIWRTALRRGIRCAGLSISSVPGLSDVRRHQRCGSWEKRRCLDIAEAKRIGKDYLPVVWPGFFLGQYAHE